MSTYSTNLALELIGTGEQAGVWGTTTNTNLGTLIEQAISGYVTQAVATGTDTTITIPNGATGVARNMYIELTGTGGTNTNLIVPANKKLYFIFNNSTGAVTVKVSGQTGVSVPQGKKVVLTSNGTDVVNGLNYIADFGSNSATITQLTATSATITNLTLTSLVISNLSIASANITTLTGSTQTLSGNLTLSGGTANGVAYLNGSKVVTSGSALTFNGTTLVSPDITDSSLTSGRVTYAGTGGNLVDSANLTFNGTTLTAAGFSGPLNGTVGASTPSTGAFTNLSYTGTLTGGTGIVNLGSGQFYKDASGNVGIGTASPATRLDVAGAFGTGTTAFTITNTSAASASNIARIDFRLANSFLGNGPCAAVWGTNPNAASNNGGALVFGVSANGTSTTPSEVARFDQAGNLGIGTASPATRLDVQGPFSVESSIRLTSPIDGSAVTPAGSFFSFRSGSALRETGRISSLNEFANFNGGNLVFSTSDSSNVLQQRAVIDRSGNLGLGVTPSASWFASSKAMQIGIAGAPYMGLVQQTTTTCDGYMLWGARLSGDRAFQYITTGDAVCAYRQNAGTHSWFTAPSGTAGNAISFTQAMTLDASGNLGLGTASPGGRLHITTASGNTEFVHNVTGSGTAARTSYQRGGVVQFLAGLGAWSGTDTYQISSSTGPLTTIDSSGSLGIGTVSPAYRLDVQHTTNGIGMRLRNTSTGVELATRTDATTSGIDAGNAPNGMTFSLNTVEGMRLTTTGLGIGTASPGAALELARTSADVGLYITRSSTGAASYRQFIDGDGDIRLNMVSSKNMRFFTADTERGRFTAGGYFKASNTGTYNGATGTYHEFYQTANSLGLLVRATNASYTDSVVTIVGDRTTTNSTYNLIDAYNGNISGRFTVRDSGNAVNTNGSYGTISDAKMKTDIVDAGSQWDDIKAVRFRKFKMKDDPSGITQLGVVAQELEQTSPGLVDEHADKDAEGNDLGTTTKSVKSSILLMKAAVALQEAMARIEKLEAEVAALKGA